MRNLEVILSDYLAKKTDYCIQISGYWGSGKTYYYNTTLLPIIKKTSIVSDNRKKYKPVYISLFGLKSIEEIQTRLVSEFYLSKLFKSYFPTFSSKKIKITQSLLKICFRGFLNYKMLGSVDDYIFDIKNIGEKALDTKELLICFDDLERKSKTLHIEDLTGFINKLVDEGIKVILISNDDVLLKNKEYRNFKEKIIGVTVEFVPETKKILESIIQSRYSSFPTYTEHLKSNIEIILRLCKVSKNNFRGVIFAIDILHQIYSIIKRDILDLNLDISKKLRDELSTISDFILALAVEYKFSAIKFTDKDEFKGSNILLHEIVFQNKLGNNITQADSKLNNFIQKYEIQKNRYCFYESIFHYITAYDEFRSSAFISEFTKHFNLENGITLPHYKILNLLSYDNYLQLNDSEYKNLTRELVRYAVDGAFFPEEYLTVALYTERLIEVSELNLSDLESGLNTGLLRSIRKESNNFDQSYNNFKHLEIVNKSGGLTESLYKYGICEFNKICNQRTIRIRQEWAELLTNNYEEFEKLYRSEQEFRNDIIQSKFLSYLSIPEFARQIVQANNMTINYITWLFKKRYESIDRIKEELEQLMELERLLSDEKTELNKEEGNKMRIYIFESLIKMLNNLIERGIM